MPRAEIRKRIRRLRFDQGEVTQQDLADRAGCTRQPIILLEQERYVPSLALAFRIAHAVGKGAEKVFVFKEDE